MVTAKNLMPEAQDEYFGTVKAGTDDLATLIVRVTP
jgi:hypothetical protein